MAAMCARCQFCPFDERDLPDVPRIGAGACEAVIATFRCEAVGRNQRIDGGQGCREFVGRPLR